MSLDYQKLSGSRVLGSTRRFRDAGSFGSTGGTGRCRRLRCAGSTITHFVCIFFEVGFAEGALFHDNAADNRQLLTAFGTNWIGDINTCWPETHTRVLFLIMIHVYKSCVFNITPNCAGYLMTEPP
jgi:hypothetical protein